VPWHFKLLGSYSKRVIFIVIKIGFLTALALSSSLANLIFLVEKPLRRSEGSMILLKCHRSSLFVIFSLATPFFLSNDVIFI